ncbi:MAG: NAD+ synthase [Proteobacteria bacterium]|nr:NAD+ synthase [Pseudomonadota bacterium]MBI3497761.1 NAD+ synthase [Pseudomonadota bacterium]
MTDKIGIALAQINPVVGDIEGNLAKLRWARLEAAWLGADLVVPGELAVSGYPPEDLVLKPAFLAAVVDAVEGLAADTADGGPAVLATAPWPHEGKTRNAALLLDGGKIVSTRFKHDLPNYGVFDEKRVFAPGPMPGPMVCRGVRLGVMICEDMWTPDAAETLEESGAEILIVPNGSPFELDKLDTRHGLGVARVAETGLPLVYVNQIGGQDEVVFDGASFVLAADGSTPVQLPAWQETVSLTLWRRGAAGWRCEPGLQVPPSAGLEAIYQAMMLGLRDYVRKNRFPGVILGLSGGIDSALTAAVAADALGPSQVHCVMMPSPYTSSESLEDAAEVARLLSVRLDTVPIEPAMQAFARMLAPSFDSLPADITEENLQSRARGITLMALSNKFGPMVLSTGNKSEMSVGYATLYGDMCGGYAVLKDIYKMTVFQLARWRNQLWPAGALGPAGRVMPERVITKPPSAELKPNQTDQDTLPAYEVLDDILSGLIEREEDVAAIVARGHDEATVRRVWRMLDRAEYKRRQAPPGVKITSRAFGRDRRYPITNAFQR